MPLARHRACRDRHGAVRLAVDAQVDQFLAISSAVKRSLPASWQAKTCVVHNGVEVDRLAAEAARRSGELRRLLGVAPDKKLIISLATFSPHKGQHLLIQAMRPVASARSDVLCVLIGVAPNEASRQYLHALRDQARRDGLGDCCRFLLDVSEPATLLADGDVVAVTTFGRGEGFGLVIAEAMACGVPVVAFDAGAAAELVRHGQTGLVVPDADCDALAEALLALLADPHRRQAMGQAAHKEAKERFDAAQEARGVVEVYGRLSPMDGH